MAERLARLALATRPSAGGAAIDTMSAGTHARAGDTMHPGAERVLVELGADASGFRSRPLSQDLLARASLVLTATRDQRAFCVRLAPLTLRRTFTIRQFGRLAAAADGQPLGPTDAATPTVAVAMLLQRVAEVRGGLQPGEPADDDLADPVNGTEADIRACAHQIQLSLRPALTLIGSV